ncbi:MAG: thioredoxin-dependent thiol peroxidase [Candidatus Aenigmarchaeota archaeon]|nr:thioredoxin-dependent thiol peroxidase [Candidatus Aenigmarchaeota archaeon]
MLKEGHPAPEFSLLNQEGKNVSLKDFRKKYIVLYFYPKDNTPGCTIEALDFTKLKLEFEKLNCVIIGISKDSCESHKKFIDKKSLSLVLLSDIDKEVNKLYGVWKPKKFMGKEFLGTVRSTFLIDQKGNIAKIWYDVSALGHAKEVLDYLKSL